jgi:hypothetical protein
MKPGRRIPQAWGIFQVAALLTVISCGAAPQRATEARYTVEGALHQSPRAPTEICGIVFLSLPPADCGGVEVRGVEIRTVKGARVYGDGTVEANDVQLVGTWDGHALTATRSPQTVSPTKVVQIPDCGAVAQPASTTQRPSEIARQIQEDAVDLRTRGIPVIAAQVCGNTVLVVVPVADRGTVDYLRNRYDGLAIVSWFRAS